MAKQNRNTGRMASHGNMESDSEPEGMDNALHKLFLAKAAQSNELREALESHLEETEEHISRLEEVFESLDESVKNKTCKAMQGLIAEGDEIVKEQKDSSALDAGIIAACQKVEHYEIATYGTLCAWAEQMGHGEALELLRQTEEEEVTADEKLTEVAETVANQRAQSE